MNALARIGVCGNWESDFRIPMPHTPFCLAANRPAARARRI
jgi:hypothetical protein